METAGRGRSPRTLSSMQNTGEKWNGLLGILTEEELDQYGQMAMDQVRKETRRGILHVPMVLAAVALLLWSAWTIYYVGEPGWLVYVALAAAALFVYIPWRSVKTRKLWQGHYERVKEEMARRQRDNEVTGG